MRRTLICTGIILAFGGLTLAAEPATQPAAIDPTNAAAVKAAVGQEATVEGKVVSADWSASGKVLRATFAKKRGTLELIIFQAQEKQMNKAFPPDIATALQGNQVRATGKIEEYRGRPEMIIRQTSQLKIISSPTTEPQNQTGH